MSSRVLAVIQDGCNTSEDVAEELGISVNLASMYVSTFLRSGYLRRTGRLLRNKSGMLALKVFEINGEDDDAIFHEQGTARRGSQCVSVERVRGRQAACD